MNIITPKHLVKLDELVARPGHDRQDVDRARHQPSFARGMAASEFGGRFWSWRQWGEFENFAPDNIEALRATRPRELF